MNDETSMHEPEAVLPTDEPLAQVAKLVEGNLGALEAYSALAQCLHNQLVHDLVQANLRGSRLWIAYKDFAEFDAAKLFRALHEYDPALARAVNAIVDPDGPQVITPGNSRENPS